MAIQLGASSSSSSSSPSIHPWSHDVFLSFRGEDVRAKFISHLKRALCESGITTYVDSVNLERGEQISSLFKAIEESRISIIVFSKNYADSKWCLDELLKILECQKLFKQIVLPIFYEIKPSDIREQKGSFGEAFTKLGKEIKDDKKLLEYWKEALEEVAKLSGFEYKLASGDDESEFIQKIIRWVNSRIPNQTPLYVAEYPIEIESRIRAIYQLLSLEKNDIIRMVGIFGIGGIGKTTFSKDIYNKISSQFEGCCFLSNIKERSKREGLIELQKILLSEILGKTLDIYDADRGVNVIRDSLHFKRVLLILDDVDELDQLKKLAGDRAWFGLGSRIIITTRDQQLLIQFFEVDDPTYELRPWDDNEALRLFSLHAFKKDEPLDEYVELSKQVIKYAQGLPLALKVLGSDLKGQSIPQWKSALDKYKSIPHRNIQSVLRISYDGLEDNEKQMFLDIAFFFKGGSLAEIMKIFDGCKFFPDYGIDRLIKKCLITIEYKSVEMHDLLQDMGREIVRLESPFEPGERSRLWFHEDIRRVLEESTGTNKVSGMIIEMPKGEDAISLNSVAFSQMERLRVLIIRNASFTSGPNYLSNKLRVLDWFEYPLQSLPPNFDGKKLIIFKMRGSCIKELSFIKCYIKYKDLTIMRLLNCNFLTKVPDLSSLPNLKILKVESCTSLVEVHDSVGFLENLCLLNFVGCSNLKIFPRSLKLRSLVQLHIRGCSSLRCFPEIPCEMKSLCSLVLWGTALEELPLSFGNLTGVEFLNLSLPLQHLTTPTIGGCTNLLKKMGHDRQSILAIESPTMEDELSSSEEQLQELAPTTNSSNGSSELQVLNRRNCFQSESNFFPISSFLTMSNFSATLTLLNLWGSQIVSLPKSIKGFVALTVLRLEDCKKLEEILELPPNIRMLYASGCQSLERFPELSRILEFNGSHNRSLYSIGWKGCDKLDVKIWNYKVPNPLLWKGRYDKEFFENEIPEWFEYDKEFLENEIPEWFQCHKEFLENEIAKRGDDDVQLKGNEEWVINIAGPHYLEDISRIVIYVVAFFDEDHRKTNFEQDVEVIISNSYCEVRLLSSGRKGLKLSSSQSEVRMWYSDLKSFEVKVLDNLRIQLRPHPDDEEALSECYYISMGANVVYKQESKSRRKMD